MCLHTKFRSSSAHSSRVMLKKPKQHIEFLTILKQIIADIKENIVFSAYNERQLYINCHPDIYHFYDICSKSILFEEAALRLLHRTNMPCLHTV